MEVLYPIASFFQTASHSLGDPALSLCFGDRGDCFTYKP